MHEKGGLFVCQLWHVGRVSHPGVPLSHIGWIRMKSAFMSVYLHLCLFSNAFSIRMKSAFMSVYLHLCLLPNTAVLRAIKCL